MKVLAIHLAPKVYALVEPCQNMFIKGRCVQKNYIIYLQNTSKKIHNTKKVAILLKLDQDKAFNTTY